MLIIKIIYLPATGMLPQYTAMFLLEIHHLSALLLSMTNFCYKFLQNARIHPEYKAATCQLLGDICMTRNA
jgi:hypothetical protein